MTIKRAKIPLVAAFCLALPVAAHADMSVKVMADACAGCHGTDGASAGAMPAFNNKAADVIEKALLEYKTGAKEATVMDRITKGYSDEQLKAISVFYGKK
jgi:cytochrome c553